MGFQTNTSASSQYALENSPNVTLSFGANAYIAVCNFGGPDEARVKRVVKGYDSSGTLLTFADGEDYIYEQESVKSTGQALEYLPMTQTGWTVTPEPNEDLNQLRVSWEVYSESGNVEEVAIYDKVQITFP